MQCGLLGVLVLIDGVCALVSNMFNKLSGQPESYEKKYAFA